MTDAPKHGSRGAGMLYRQPKSKNWWYQYHDRGKRVRGSTRTANKREAEAFLRRLLTARDEGKPNPNASRKLNFAALEALLKQDYILRQNRSWARAERSMRQLADVFGRDHVVDITADRLADYATECIEEGEAHATVRTRLAALKRSFRLALKQGKLSFMPGFPEITVDNAEIVEAAWYSRGSLPRIPPRISIARQLIDWFAGGRP